MIYFTAKDIFLAIFVFFILGVIFGGAYSSLNLIFNYVKFSFFTVLRARKKYKRIESNDLKPSANSKSRSSVIFLQISDFLYFLFLSITYIFSLYVFLDGVFRGFSLILLLFGYLFSKKTLGRLFEKCIRILLEIIIKTIDFLFFFLLSPIFFTYDIIYKLTKPIILSIKERYDKALLKRKIQRKRKKIEKLF